MKIALMNEFSQAAKNPIVLAQLKDVVEPMGHVVYNTAMAAPLVPQDVPEAYTEENPRLTYLHLGIQACLLLNSGAVDFVVTGCGTGQGALMSLNTSSPVNKNAASTFRIRVLFKDGYSSEISSIKTNSVLETSKTSAIIKSASVSFSLIKSIGIFLLLKNEALIFFIFTISYKI